MVTGRFLLIAAMCVALSMFAAAQVRPTVTAPCTVSQKLTPLPALPEASGLALSRRMPGTLWSINDSGEPALRHLSAQGASLATVNLTGAEVRDWEDVSVGPCPGGSCIYLADIGDNNRRRNHVVFYRTQEPGKGGETSPAFETFTASYDDGPHDAEAAFVTSDGMVYVVTKESTPLLFRLSSLKSRAALKLERVTSLPIEGKITDGETSPDGSIVALRTADTIVIYRTQALTSGNVSGPRVFDLSNLREPQGEGVALASDGTIFVVGEGGGGGAPGTFARLTCKLP